MSILRPHNVDQLRAWWRTANGVPDDGRPSWRMEAGGDGTPKLIVFGVIGGWDNDAGEFVQALHALDADAVDVHVNSPGGFVYDGIAMYEALAGHRAQVAMHIDGLAASAASFLVQAGNSIDIAAAGRMMIHDAQVVAFGAPADLREAADIADAISDDIAGIYAARAGGKPSTWRASMTATTWYSAGESVAAGLADTVRKATTKAAPDNRTSQLIRARARVHLGR